MCFEPILTVMVACNSLLCVSQYLVRIQDRQGSLNALNSVEIQPSLLITLSAPASGLVLEFDPSDLLLELARNRQPRQLCFSEETITPTAAVPKGAVKAPDLNLIRQRIIQSVFTNYYETQQTRVKAIWGTLPKRNPIWQFAWLVRNAFAHGDRINWINPGITSVAWKKVSYSYPGDNNRAITLKEIGEGDLNNPN